MKRLFDRGAVVVAILLALTAIWRPAAPASSLDAAIARGFLSLEQFNGVLHAQGISVGFVYAQGTAAQGGPFSVTSGAVVRPSTVATGSGNAWASDVNVYGCSLNIQGANVMATDGYTSGTKISNGVVATPTALAGNLLTPGSYYFASRNQCLNLKIIAVSTTAQWYIDAFRP